MNTMLSPENLIVAVLHKVGTSVRLTDDVRLAALFHSMAEKHPEYFGPFAWHPQYHDSPLLKNTLQNLDLGGAIVRENASIKRFRVSPRVEGSYGETVFESLPDEIKLPVESLSEEIRAAFNSSSQLASV